jgi:hypothetical protein
MVYNSDLDGRVSTKAKRRFGFAAASNLKIAAAPSSSSSWTDASCDPIDDDFQATTKPLSRPWVTIDQYPMDI